MGIFKVAIIIPAFNESHTIQNVVKEVSKYGTPIVVDDGSIDETSEIACKYGAKVVTHNTNLGYDNALSSGFLKAKEIGSEIAITFDADGQHDSKMIQSYLKYLDDGYDLICGNRKNKQRFGEIIFGLFTSIVYGIKDPLCGMKGYKMTLYNKLGHFDSYNSVGTELALFSIKNKFTFKELDLSTSLREDNPRFADLFGGNYRIFRSLILSLIYIKKI